MPYKKTIGWLLVAAGLIVIVWALYSAYNVFTGKTLPPEIFKTEERAVSNSPALNQEDIGKMVGQQIGNLIPPDFLPKILNLIARSILASIFILGGGWISSVGIKLLKE